MSIDNPAQHNLKIRRGRDYVKVFNFNIDISAWTGQAEIRATPDDDSTLIATFAVVVGAYAAGVTPVTLTLTDTVTDGVTAESGFWDLLLTSDSAVDETYIEGNVRFKNVPTKLV